MERRTQGSLRDASDNSHLPPPPPRQSVAERAAAGLHAAPPPCPPPPPGGATSAGPPPPPPPLPPSALAKICVRRDSYHWWALTAVGTATGSEASAAEPAPAPAATLTSTANNDAARQPPSGRRATATGVLVHVALEARTSWDVKST